MILAVRSSLCPRRIAGLRTAEMLKVYATDQVIQWEDIDSDWKSTSTSARKWQRRRTVKTMSAGSRSSRPSSPGSNQLPDRPGRSWNWLRALFANIGANCWLAWAFLFRLTRCEIHTRELCVYLPKLRRGRNSDGGPGRNRGTELSEQEPEPNVWRAWFDIRPDTSKILQMAKSA